MEKPARFKVVHDGIYSSITELTEFDLTDEGIFPEADGMEYHASFLSAKRYLVSVLKAYAKDYLDAAKQARKLTINSVK